MKFFTATFHAIRTWTQKPTSKYWLGLGLFICLVGLVFVRVVWAQDVDTGAPVGSATATAVQDGAGPLSFVAKGLAFIFYLAFIYIPGWILALVTNVMVWVLSYQGFGDEAIVTKGWTVLRDLSNMFFILILVVVAVGTIVKSGRYGYQQNLRRLILMAILINFSKTITLFFIDLSQAVTLTFVNAFLDAIQGGFPKLLGLTGWMTLWQGSDFPQANILTVLLQIGLGGIMLLVTLVVVSVITFLFLMRIIMFVFIIILSPVAFLCSTLPTASKYYLEWWDNLSKYLVLGPTLAFFLWLSFAVVNEGGPGVLSGTISDRATDSSSSSVSVVTDSTTNAPSSASNTSAAKSLIRFFVAISLLFGSLMMAGKLGTVGAGISKKASGKLTGIGKSVLVGRSGAGGLVGTARSLAAMPIGGAANLLDRGNQLTNMVTGRLASNVQRGVSSVAGEKVGRFAGDVTRTVAKGTIQVMGGAALNPAHRAAREFARMDSTLKAQDIEAKRKAMKYDPVQTRLNAIHDVDRNGAAAAVANLVSDGEFKNGKNEQYVDAAHEALKAGGQTMEKDLENFEQQNWSRISNEKTRNEIAVASVAKGEADKLIAGIHADSFEKLPDTMRKSILDGFSAAGGSSDDIEKGIKRQTKEAQKTFSKAYAKTYHNNEKSLGIMARLDADEFVKQAQTLLAANPKDPAVKNTVGILKAEQIVRLDPEQLKVIAPELSHTQIKGAGEMGNVTQREILIKHAKAADPRVVKQIMEADTFADARVNASGDKNLATMEKEWETISNLAEAYDNAQIERNQYYAEAGASVFHAGGKTPPKLPKKPQVRPTKAT